MSAPLRGHQRLDRRSLELHRAVAEKLRAHPELIEIAHDNLERWSKTAGRSQPYLDEWRRILARPLPEILDLLVEESERMTALRQAGTLCRSSRTGGTLGNLCPLRAGTARAAMTRSQLEHIIRAAGTIADVDDITVIGSQAVLGKFPAAPAELLVSKEVGDLIDGTIGEGSPFERSFGYCAHGVDESTAILPEGWRERLVLVNRRKYPLHPRLVPGSSRSGIAKYAAGREKDRDFTKALARHAMVRRDLLEQRLATTPLDPQLRSLVSARIQADFSVAGCVISVEQFLDLGTAVRWRYVPGAAAGGADTGSGHNTGTSAAPNPVGC